MKFIGITGETGFVGKHLKMLINTKPENFTLVPFNRTFFEDGSKMDEFVSRCDAIVHLAGMNRHDNPQVIYDTNITLTENLISSLERTNSKAHVLFSSSSQEDRENLYGSSKKKARELLKSWAEQVGAVFTGMIVPNVFGPFGKPYYNSVVATFAHQISSGEEPTIQVDGELKLIYVLELVQEVLDKINDSVHEPEYVISHTAVAKVSEVLNYFQSFKTTYQDLGVIPVITNTFELHLFNTYRCYMDIKSHFPVKFTQHTDPRGSFVEIIRLGIGGQVSFSTTMPGITRGNHYHTRKIERFAVIKGKALIQLRKIGTDEVLDFYLDGDEPAFVDMPIWYTHNIKNIGNDVLYTNFWINEPYDAADADTYYEEV
ncbi:NAD-dependent epimerase/dehydratase family protein [Dokdonia sp. Hel_I_53]|uniref:polysaccharide biosynthesis C-terminal domain-containing protein n=1 Tax=Dokdonia sp. Hel_I_53 TaxID=1566287 RepID=UPI001199457E|nr:NAD-dependent epimerase/dehydratase family protein [Dokdonia sp. Hel_I_53]TVZ51345.1 UDP-2-acetamido-2,6-beta-L-arabino-hexul-4-ose reductase [Dokdonia sp. Hel_I_53]